MNQYCRAGFSLNPIIVVITALLLGACTFQFAGKEETAPGPDLGPPPVPVGKVKPEIDFSNETPDCELAAMRISETVEVGMTLGDVRRLVGNPRVVLPGRWLWAKGFAIDGRPSVSYGFSPPSKTLPIKAFSAESFGC